VPFLEAAVLREVLPRLTPQEIAQLLYLWILEGIPHAFIQYPMLYGSLRNWLAKRFDVPERNVTLVGSARIGFSLKEFGRPFNTKSDLDFALVSEPWFNKLEDDFLSWKSDFEHERIQPSTIEKRFWVDNLSRVPENIRRGFITANDLPNRYQNKQEVANAMWMIHQKLQSTPGAPNFKKATIRIYRDWDSLVNQNTLNLFVISKALTA